MVEEEGSTGHLSGAECRSSHSHLQFEAEDITPFTRKEAKERDRNKNLPPESKIQVSNQSKGMASNPSNQPFQTLNLEGKSRGASMYLSSGCDGGRCINIYINSNIQGVDNSIVDGSALKMVNPGVKLYFGDVRFSKTSKNVKKKKKKKKTSQQIIGSRFGFCGISCFVISVLFIFIFMAL